MIHLAVFGLLAGCSGPQSIGTATSTGVPESRWDGSLDPYVTSTFTPEPTLKPTQFQMAISPTPTSTPFTHVVAKGETMLGIAIKYGVSLDDLKSANPEIDPRLMSVGQVLIVPILVETDITQPEVSLTPIPIRLSEPRCYISSDGSVGCLVEVVNQHVEAVESIQVWIGLYNTANELVSSQVGITPINILLEDVKMGLAVFFQPPVPEFATARAEIITAIRGNDVENRYVKTITNEKTVVYSQSKMAALVQGEIVVETPVNWVWATAIAYDHTGKIVGIRKWKGQPECDMPEEAVDQDSSSETPIATVPIEPCGPFKYDFSVYSLGPEISRVEVISEAGR